MATKRSKVPATKTTTPMSSAPATPATPSARPPSPDAIAARAYELWRESGGAHGHDQADWFRAEQELRVRAR